MMMMVVVVLRHVKRSLVAMWKLRKTHYSKCGADDDDDDDDDASRW